MSNKFNSLLKISLLVSIAPIMVLSIFTIFNKIEFIYSVIGSILIFILSLILLRPYVADLYNLTNYVKKLANDNKIKLPNLKYLKNIENLTVSIDNLNHIWQKKEFELEARVLENKTIFDTLPDMLIMLDGRSKIIRANFEAIRILGASILNQNIGNVIDNEILKNHINWVMHEKQLKSIELFLPELQKYYMVKIAKFPSYDIDSIAIILIITDISEAKRTEQMFIDFVANASHEIKTPLSSIKGFVEIIQTSAKDDPEAQENFLKIIAEQAERLNLLVNELLSLSKLEMDAGFLPDIKLNITEIIEIVHKELELAREDKNVIFKFNIIDNVPLVIGDKNQLIQVFTNLFSNAIKYGNSNSEVSIIVDIELNPIAFQTNIEKWLRIRVIDEGEGIEKEHIPRLTERFYRVDSSRIRNKKIGGTGLGLAIVKQILNKHQGELVIESTIGVGSIFTVYLPIEHF